MKNYLNSDQLDITKTYYKFVDVAVKLTNGKSLFMECLPPSKKQRNTVIFQILGTEALGYNEEVIRTKFRIKDKWL
tara:strand:+ start:384 stop:611 length:228 start_codon:yes stop_codon:yes gene_type:complete